MRWWGVAFAIALVTAPSVARATPTTDECIDANTKSQSLRRAGKLREAREQLLLCGSPSCPKMVRDDCAQRTDEVDRAIPTIVFQVKDAQGHDLTDVKVTMDGAPLVDKLAGTALQVDVGDHTFAFVADGYNPLTQQFVIVESQKDRRETLTLVSVAPVVQPVVEPPPVQPPPAPPVVVPLVVQPPPQPPIIPPPPVVDPSAVDARRLRRTTGIVLTVFGVASLGGALAFAVLGGNQNSAIQAGGFATASDIASADNLGTAYNVAFGVALAGGLVLAAIGLPLILTNLGDGTPTRSARLHVGPRGVGVQW